MNFPNPRHVYTDIEGSVPRNQEFDPKDYYPPDVYRKPDPVWPQNFKIDVVKMLRDKVVSKIQSVFGANE